MNERLRILVTGGTGQLGQSLQEISARYSDCEFFFADRRHLDFSKSASIALFFEHHSFDIVINCAAYTAVDRAEEEPELASQVNHTAVQHLGNIVRAKHMKFVHVSTDYVFDGESRSPYLESDYESPAGVYGKTKFHGEQSINGLLERNAIVIRTSWVFSEYGNNFVKTMLALGAQKEYLDVVYDQIGSPTYAKDLAEAIMQIVCSERFKMGFETHTLHYSSEGLCSWFDFAKAIFELADVRCKTRPVTSAEFRMRAFRPAYSVLDKTKIKNMYGINIPYWRDSLKLCLSRLASTNE